MDYRIELVPLAVSDVDRSREFYGTTLGWSVDHDQVVSPELRFVQVTPPGSACSIAFGQGITTTAPGSVQGLQVVVADVHEARTHLAGRGIGVSDVQEFPWGSFVYFSDPDGNGWSVQQLPAGR